MIYKLYALSSSLYRTASQSQQRVNNVFLVLINSTVKLLSHIHVVQENIKIVGTGTKQILLIIKYNIKNYGYAKLTMSNRLSANLTAFLYNDKRTLVENYLPLSEK